MSTITRTDLTSAQEANLVAIVRETESATVFDFRQGREVVRFFPTREQDDALALLISTYISDIRRAARSARVIDRDDAESVATEKFISLVRNGNGTNERLAGYVSRAMVNAVMDADAEASAIRIPPDTLRRYFNLVRECGSVDAAYEKCRNEVNNFDPITLLAVNRALNAESVEALTGHTATANDGRSSEVDKPALAAATSTPSHEEDIVQADLVRWLFTLVPEDRERILRLAYGFMDAPTEDARVRNGYPGDLLLSDAQIAPVVGASRAKVQRDRVDALRTMAAALQAIIDES